MRREVTVMGFRPSGCVASSARSRSLVTGALLVLIVVACGSDPAELVFEQIRALEV